MGFRIGSLDLKYGLILAPMAGVTDRAYRNVCYRHGAELAYTEMVSAKALHYKDESSFELASVENSCGNIGVQLFGHEADMIAEGIKLLTSEKQKNELPVSIDINMGCPMKKIVNNNDGSALMKTPALAGSIVKMAKEVTGLPVSVKIRAGWDSESKNAVRVAEIAEENGADAIYIHGRTREQMYSPEVDLDIIASVKKAVNIPVIGNGGIYTSCDALTMLDKTNCDGVMLARGTMGNPWLFEEIIAELNGTHFVLPDIDERLNEALIQMDEMLRYKGDRIGVLEARRQVGYYIKDIKGASAARGKLNSAESADEIKQIVYDLIR